MVLWFFSINYLLTQNKKGVKDMKVIDITDAGRFCGLINDLNPYKAVL